MSEDLSTEVAKVEEQETTQIEEQDTNVKRSELESYIKSVDNRFESVEKLFNKGFSSLDNRIAAASKKAEELVEVGKLSGMQFSQEQIAQIKDKLVHQALMNAPEQEKPSQPQEVDPVTATAQMIMQKAGVVIAQDDPEISLVDRTTDDPGVFLESVRKAIEAKKQRLNRPAGNAAAVPGALATGSAPANLIEQFQREMREHRGQGMRVANEIKNKYRQKGVDVDNIRISW